MLSRIPEDILNTVIQQNHDSLHKVISCYRSGLTESECRNTCRDILYKDLTADRIQPACLEPWPKGLIIPDIHAGHFPNDLLIGWNLWNNDKSTLDEALQNDTPIVLTDQHGLKTCIRLNQGKKSDVLSSQAQGYTEYIGTGTIEGYTSDRPREIQITISEDGQIRCLLTRQDHDDIEAFQNFYLWKEYQQKMQELRQQEEHIIVKLMDSPMFQ